MQRIEECAAAPPAIIAKELEVLQEHEQAEDVRIPRVGHAELLLFGLTVFRDGVLDAILNLCRQRIRRARLVIDAALQGAVSAYQAIERLANVEVDDPWCFHRGFTDRSGDEPRQRLIVAKELLSQFYVAIGNVLFGDVGRLFTPVGFLKVLAIEGAIDGDFALIAAAEGANIAANARAEPARTAGVANCARHPFSIEVG